MFFFVTRTHHNVSILFYSFHLEFNACVHVIFSVSVRVFVCVCVSSSSCYGTFISSCFTVTSKPLCASQKIFLYCRLLPSFALAFLISSSLNGSQLGNTHTGDLAGGSELYVRTAQST